MSGLILVVDDEPDVADLFRQQFRKELHAARFVMEFALSAADALERVHAAKAAKLILILSDINMPGMTGLELLPRARQARPDVPVIMITAYGDADTRRKAIEGGASGPFTKPIDFADFETTIRKTIAHVTALRDARGRQAAAERAHASLSRYFSPNLARRLASDTETLDLRGQRRQIATLFTDIAGFTTLVETLEPDVLGPLLNDYLVCMTDVVFAHDGTVAKIIGDAIHVLFSAPTEQPNHAERAVSCALALDSYAQVFRDRWRQNGIALGVTRI